MNIFDYLHTGKDFVNIALRSEEYAHKDAIERYKTNKLIAVIGTIVVLVLCIGAMYIRFRVFGG